MSNSLPQSIGSYQILSQIGRGGMGVVYLAHQRSLQRNVALKVLPAQLAEDRSFVERFLREARIAASLQHPHIIKIFEVGESAPYFIAMEFVQGSPLSSLIQQTGTFAPARAAAILTQLAAALDYAHARGVIHRDLKPSNIMLDASDNAVLMDFGIARAIESAKMTQTGTLMGTPEYMAPELAQGGEATAQTDLYALGIIAYEMVTGRAPFHATTPLGVLHQHAFTPPPTPRQLNPQLSPSIETVLLKSLAKDPVQRYSTAVEFARDLERATRGEKITAAPVPLTRPSQTETPPRHTPAAWWVVGGLVALVALVILSALLLRVTSPASTTTVDMQPTAVGDSANSSATAPTVLVANVSPSIPATIAAAAPTFIAVPTETPNLTATAAFDATRIAGLLEATVSAAAQETQVILDFVATQTAQAPTATLTPKPPTITPIPTRRPPTRIPPTEIPTEAPPTPTRVFFPMRLVSPSAGAAFGSEFEPPLLEWRPVTNGALAENEWYRIQTSHNGPPICNIYTKETVYSLPPSGVAGEGCDPNQWRFNTGDWVWRVSFVVRVDGDVSHDQEIQNSEGRLFHWNK